MAQNLTGGNFDAFDAFQPESENLICQIFKALQQCLQAHGKRQ